MRRLIFSVVLLTVVSASFAQQAANSVPRPKLVVGIVVDQMRWDYLYRYYDRYEAGGFKRLLNDGFSCENTFINYLPSYTAVGHTTIYTGAVPAISGITGNDWTEQLTGKNVYCTDDSTVTSVGNDSEDGKMSPRNLLVSTITDELRLATNFRSKVVGVSLKDRASILPAGHLANAAFWLDDASGHFISSSYYMKELPSWVSKYNDKNRIQALIKKGWSTMYPIKTYVQSDSDDQSYEGKFPGEKTSTFPHAIDDFYKQKKGIFRSTPFGNTLTLEFAQQAVENYKLGQGDVTDFLTINCASTDYVGHMYGPNSIEVEDTYLRLDKDLSDFFNMLDQKLGKGQYLVFLSADHGAAHNVDFMAKHNLPADTWNSNPLKDSLNKMLATKFGTPNLIRSIKNYQVNFDLDKIDTQQLDFEKIKKETIAYLLRQPNITQAIDIAAVGSSSTIEPLKSMVANGYYFKRCGAIQIILNPGYYEGSGRTGTTHGTWNPYDTHIPLVWYGWHIKSGKSNKHANMTDIAPTIAALLQIQMPNGCVGNVIEEIKN
ncbi:alkaline phosphatase PafA [Pinibacter aurantiacus]|uniref:Alkaline phosphatase family protein n=1 Tax=Pinibacter aurantiacus TaxID=2851599 RepID=A0A9E2W3G3_9BACT|nr:alkaline phosphatase PafA [Pinibacter aurantiacus]MBV4358515.1 alkaline phosphatase family protein [Pinibacter aurantiacus]